MAFLIMRFRARLRAFYLRLRPVRVAYGVKVTAKNAEVLEYPGGSYWRIDQDAWLRIYSMQRRKIAELRPETWAIVETASMGATE